MNKELLATEMKKAYKEAGPNAYFGNGFYAGVEFAESLQPAWQPIETAPKDGTVILGYCRGIQKVVNWIKGFDKWTLIFSFDPNNDGWYEPTHWQPLPENPKE